MFQGLISAVLLLRCRSPPPGPAAAAAAAAIAAAAAVDTLTDDAGTEAAFPPNVKESLLLLLLLQNVRYGLNYEREEKKMHVKYIRRNEKEKVISTLFFCLCSWYPLCIS